MKFTCSALLTIVTLLAVFDQNAFGQQTPAATAPAATALQKRAELKPGPRPLTQRERELLRDARLAYAAQAKNDVKTFLHYMADEYLSHEFFTGELETKETWRQTLTKMGAAQESSIKGKLPDVDALELGKQEAVVIAGDTAIQTSTGQISSDGKNWVPVRSTSVWIHRDGRWQRLTGSHTESKQSVK